MLVADGMGGHNSGDVASQLASQLCAEQLKRSLQTGHVPIFFHVPPNPNLDPRSLILGDCIKFSNQAVFEAGQSNPANHNMGTTMVAALWLDSKLAIAHVGDSRLYVVHNGKLDQVTVDHSFVQEQVDLGTIKPEDAEKSNFKNVLTRSVGVKEDVEVDIQELSLQKGDYILLCSDGLTKMMKDEKIFDVIRTHVEPTKIVEELIIEANKAGGGDNVTAVVARIEGSNFGSLADRVKTMFSKKGGRG
jgi:protein phosphatase